jgi:hypothetical protein
MSLINKFKKSHSQVDDNDISLSSITDFSFTTPEDPSLWNLSKTTDEGFCSTFHNFVKKTEKCTYHTAEVFLETDQITEEEKDFIRNCIYRQELLNLFDLEEFDQQKIIEEIQLLYEEIKFDEDIQYILEKVEGTYLINREDCFLILFSFDYLHITQLCLCDYFTTGKIEEEHLVSLLASIYEDNIDKI